ncbi:hypothetical protein G6F40_016643 [Rhizopus arrhizus]|nr:hypothetical protein G6F40_016643 [Rhizopus arrhizus]
MPDRTRSNSLTRSETALPSASGLIWVEPLSPAARVRFCELVNAGRGVVTDIVLGEPLCGIDVADAGAQHRGVDLDGGLGRGATTLDAGQRAHRVGDIDVHGQMQARTQQLQQWAKRKQVVAVDIGHQADLRVVGA